MTLTLQLRNITKKMTYREHLAKTDVFQGMEEFQGATATSNCFSIE